MPGPVTAIAVEADGSRFREPPPSVGTADLPPRGFDPECFRSGMPHAVRSRTFG